MSSSPTVPRPNLVLAAFVDSDQDAKVLQQGFHRDYTTLTTFTTIPEFIDWVDSHRHELDGVILDVGADLPSLVEQLYQRAILLPAVLFTAPPLSTGNDGAEFSSPGQSSHPPQKWHYHQAEVPLPPGPTGEESLWEQCLQQAIGNFLQLNTRKNTQPLPHSASLSLGKDYHQILLVQQHRLAEKLRARLGYLGVYYKRDERHFFRHLEPEEQDELISTLREEYRAIVLAYFDAESNININIDNLVDKAFFADISVAKIVEVHMWLMDEFSKQLKLEGRSPEILLDYRLTLIDVIAHLCEMYRRSIPREP